MHFRIFRIRFLFSQTKEDNSRYLPETRDFERLHGAWPLRKHKIKVAKLDLLCNYFLFFIVPLSPFIVPLFGSSYHFRAEPRDKAVILGAAEFLGHAHRAPPFRRTRHHAAILHALQSRHNQNRIRANWQGRPDFESGHNLYTTSLSHIIAAIGMFYPISSCIRPIHLRHGTSHLQTSKDGWSTQNAAPRPISDRAP